MSRFITQESIELVNSAADIVTVVSDYVHLERRGSTFWGCCPFHGEKTPSFNVNPEKNAYYCFGCHAGGVSAANFIQAIEKVSYPEAITLLANKFGVRLSYTDSGNENTVRIDETKQKTVELYDRVSSTFHYFLTQDSHGKYALDYITKRGITMETIEKFRLGYAPADRYWLKNFLKKKNFSDEFLNKSGLFSQNYPSISFFTDRLMFPIFDRRGKCVAMGGRILHPQGENDRKYLNSRDLPHYSKKSILYAFNFAKEQIRRDKTAVICEGYMDCIAYHQCGIKNAVATCGTALTEEHVKLLAQTTDCGTVLLSFDSDGAGQNATKKSILLCRKAGLTVKIVRLRGGKDPAEIMLNYGAEILTSDVKNAIIDFDYLFENLSHEYPVDTPEGKSRAAQAFFTYVDALQTDIQKESSLEQLCQRLKLSVQSVLRDFNNRSQPRNSFKNRSDSPGQQPSPSVNVDAELKAVLAVIADTSQFELMHRELNEDMFESADARHLFSILEDCYQQGSLSFNSVCERCQNENLIKLITQGVMSGEYSENTQKIVQDGISLIRQKGFVRQRNYINARVKEIGNPATQAEKDELTQLLKEKMNIDRLINFTS